MTLSIKEAEADALARRLAGQTSESVTEAVKRALQDRLDRESAGQTGAPPAERLPGVGRYCPSHVTHAVDSGNHGSLFSDDLGLPK